MQRAEERQRAQEADEERFTNELHGLQQTLRTLASSGGGGGGMPRAAGTLLPDVASRTVPAAEGSERAKRAHVGMRYKEH